jgi:hypothetical protein
MSGFPAATSLSSAIAVLNVRMMAIPTQTLSIGSRSFFSLLRMSYFHTRLPFSARIKATKS